ncbi:MAG: hypothetical protein LBH32_05435 [Dysgonamonadaceae bacterium]|jgi:organic radical activating enzyme|nr:hypothetical protein [Dysgonamonadaceae bacterium]
MKELIIPPVQLTFITTNKCTASCQNCCFQCNPGNNNKLTLSEMKQYIDQSLEVYNTIKLLILTGGECFTLGKDMNCIIKYASSKGLYIRVVTNGYWATSFDKAYKILHELAGAGLTEINFSTGDEHQMWIPYDNIVYGIMAALELNLAVAINVESSKLSQFNINQLKYDVRLEKYKSLFDKKLLIFGGVWMPFIKSTEEKLNTTSIYNKNEKSPLILHHQKGRCASLFNTISIDPFHQMVACCGLTVSYIPYLRLGSVKKYSLHFLYEYQFHDFIKIWLFTEGPEKILQFCRKKLNLPSIDTTKWHICQICVEIFRDKQNLSILRQNYGDLFPNVMLKYTLLREKYFKIINFTSYEK